jgi:hypothetical protein
MSLPPVSRARLQATLAAVIALGLWLWLRGLFATCVLLVAASIAVLAWLAPRAHAPVQRVLDRAAHGLAVGVSWALLAVVYVGMFVPMRAWRALTGHDPLGLRRDLRAESYLCALPPARPERFRRMY